MTAATQQPHPIPATCSAEEARALTDQIRGTVERTWTLLIAAYERRAWVALDYTSWQSYVAAEFGISRSRSYQLIDQAMVVREIADAAGLSTPVDIPEAVARDIKPHLAEVVDQVREAVADVPAPERPAAVADVVRDVRDGIVADRTTGEVTSPADPVPPSSAPPTTEPVDDGDGWTPSGALEPSRPKAPAKPPASKAPPAFLDSFADAMRDVRKAVNQLESLSADARFRPRAQQLSIRHLTSISDAREGLAIVVERLGNGGPT